MVDGIAATTAHANHFDDGGGGCGDAHVDEQVLVVIFWHVAFDFRGMGLCGVADGGLFVVAAVVHQVGEP